MAIDPLIARGSPGLDVSNTLARIGALKQRDQVLQQDAQQNAFMQQRYADAQGQAEEDDAEWDAAYAAKDWATMAKLDPQATKAIYEFEQAQKPQQAPAYGTQTVGGFEVLTENGKRVGYRSVPQERAAAGGGGSSKPGYGSAQDGINPETGKPDKFLVDDFGNVKWLGVSAPPKGFSTVTVGENGEMIVTPGKTNDVMRTASGFVARMTAAEKLLGEFSPGMKDYIAGSKVMSSGPVVASLANKALSPEAQKYYQAASDWVRAKLRKESGAVIGPEEMAQEIKTYFPLPGDGPDVIAQKAQARLQAVESLKTQAGGAVTPEAPQAAKPSASFEVGKLYTDAKGRKAIYIGKGKDGKDISQAPR